ncbi:neuroblast differentiation-associated protein AHNAK-like isoform X1 [Biomphalaria pfeifferi]|uniref:Neuroblast differentiation-associated protein AHNAK-like isoform X1 n=1 Tax=Biomphalaria pfeifferi TaxID=112525 RepID=A0AAD8BMZ3_BIOPF|nr:neuroblast differentiation-associated protein AHNAK-like isoform X1 [Biomphalaria pfeifferi]
MPSGSLKANLNVDADVNADAKVSGVKLKKSKKDKIKVEKDKSKSDGKSKVSKKISNWFHKKEKSVKTGELDASLTFPGEISISSAPVTVDEHITADHQLTNLNLSPSSTLETDLSVYPLNKPNIKLDIKGGDINKNSKLFHGKGDINKPDLNLDVNKAVTPLALNTSVSGKHSSEKSLDLNTAVVGVNSPSANFDLNSNLDIEKHGDKSLELSGGSHELQLPNISISTSNEDSDDGHDPSDRSGKIKKISLGSRLKTAILGKKSSEGAEKSPVSGNIEVTALTIKGGYHKPLEHCSPDHPVLSLASNLVIDDSVLSARLNDTGAKLPHERVDFSCQCDDLEWTENLDMPEASGVAKLHQAGDTRLEADLSSIQLDIANEFNSQVTPKVSSEFPVGLTTSVKAGSKSSQRYETKDYSSESDSEKGRKIKQARPVNLI